jgi:uncharacterized membrane protein YedE/YeeE
MRSAKPYVYGSLVGVSLFASVMLCGEYFGSTTSIMRVSSWVLKLVGLDPDKMRFFTQNNGVFSYHKIVSFQLMFLVGVFLGGFLSAMFSKEYRASALPSLFKEKFADSLILRLLFAFVGGGLMIVGARIAHGCASWWGLSVSSRLDMTGFATVACFFVGAVVTNFVLSRVVRLFRK